MWKRIIHNSRGMRATLIMLALFMLVAFGGALFFSRTQRTRAPEGNQATIAQQNPSQQDASLDSDADGLKDWEEQIYKTDPRNPDTDGDGTNDGDEIALGRDPLKPTTSKDPLYPNDYLTHKDTPITPSSDDRDRPNLTQKIAEIFGRDYLLNLLKDPNAQQDIDGIVDKMVHVALDQSTSTIPLITARDIIVLHNASKEDIERYLETFERTLVAALDTVPDKKNINDIVTDIIRNQDNDTAIQQLGHRVDAYNIFLNNVKKISVPDAFVTLHLTNLNTTVREREALKKIQEIKNDAMLALVGIREFAQTSAQFQNLVKQYRQLALDKGLPPPYQ